MTNVSVTIASCSTSTCVASRKSMRPLEAMRGPYRLSGAQCANVLCDSGDTTSKRGLHASGAIDTAQEPFLAG
jgi:hypothetical protein